MAEEDVSGFIEKIRDYIHRADESLKQGNFEDAEEARYNAENLYAKTEKFSPTDTQRRLLSLLRIELNVLRLRTRSSG